MKTRFYSCLCVAFIAFGSIVLSPTTLAQNANEKAAIELTNLFNDDSVVFNTQLLVLGKADAPITAVLAFGLSENTSDLVNRALPSLTRKYIDTGKLKVIVMELPLTWHDMQAFAGFRCAPANSHWEVLKAAVRDPRQAYRMKSDNYLKTPEYVWPYMKSLDVSREAMERCMRNNEVVGFVEGQRRVLLDVWNVKSAGSFIIGNKIETNPNLIGDAIEESLKGVKP